MVLLLTTIINKTQESCIHLFLIILKTFDSEFRYIAVWFTDQNSKPLEIEDKTNITLVIN